MGGVAVAVFNGGKLSSELLSLCSDWFSCLALTMEGNSPPLLDNDGRCTGVGSNDDITSLIGWISGNCMLLTCSGMSGSCDVL